MLAIALTDNPDAEDVGKGDGWELGLYHMYSCSTTFPWKDDSQMKTSHKLPNRALPKG